MEIYFYDKSMRYIGHRELNEDEEIPINATTEIANVEEGQQAYLVDGKWMVSQIPPEPITPQE